MLQTSIANWLKQPKAVKEPPKATSKAPATKSEAAISFPKPTQTSHSEAPPPRPTNPKLQPPYPRHANQPQARRPPTLPPNVTISPCTEQHITAFRRLNSLLLPIPYRADFYAETVQDPVIASITRVALWHEAPTSTSASAQRQQDTQITSSPPRLVASIRCRLLSCPPHDPTEFAPILYISTLTTLSPFRRHALASHLLATVTRTAVEEYGAIAIMAHVWEANEEAMEWYRNRGFRFVVKEEDYYRRLAPKTAAWVVRRDVGPGDLLMGGV